jgi:endonuclease G
VIWGNDATDDDFVESHGVATPEACWQLILRGQDRVIAWIVPNTQASARRRLERYLVTVAELELRAGGSFPEVPAFVRDDKPAVS